MAAILETKASPLQTTIDLFDTFTSRVEENKELVPTGDPVLYVQTLHSGVKGRVLSRIVKHIPKPVVLDTVGTDSTNYSKLVKRAKLSAHQTEELEDLTTLWHEMRLFFEWDEELLNEWVSSSLNALGGTKPSELLGSGYGRKIIRQVIEEMKYGDFS